MSDISGGRMTVRRHASAALAIEELIDRQPDGAHVIEVEIGDALPAEAELDRLGHVLANPHVISVGIAHGVVSAPAAGVLLSCDFVVADRRADWRDAHAVLMRAAQARLPALAAGSLADALVTSEQLHRAGLVVDVSDDAHLSASRLAAELRDVPRLSLIGAKHMVDASFGQDLTAALALESELQTVCLLSPEHRQIMQTKMQSPATQT